MISNKVQIEGIIQYAYTMPRDYLKEDVLNDKLAQIKLEIERHNPNFNVINELMNDSDFKAMLTSISYSYATQKLIMMNKMNDNLYTYRDSRNSVYLSAFEEDEILDCYLTEGKIVVIFTTIDGLALEHAPDEYKYYTIEIVDDKIILVSKNDNEVAYTKMFIQEKQCLRRLKVIKISRKMKGED